MEEGGRGGRGKDAPRVSNMLEGKGRGRGRRWEVKHAVRVHESIGAIHTSCKPHHGCLRHVHLKASVEMAQHV
jgi:hypothetical protein